MSRERLPRTRALTCLIALAACAMISSACSPHLFARSVAPPGRTAQLDRIDGFWTIKAYRLELSQGVAIALTCETGGPCERLRVRSDDPAIATVHEAALGALESTGYGRPAPASALIVVGRAPGTTRIRIDTRDGGRNVFVTVVAPPAANPQTAASRD